ncbi:MAG: c-type cytochrome [Woeseiaceae bacterium]|jgi:cytochrome c5
MLRWVLPLLFTVSLAACDAGGPDSATEPEGDVIASETKPSASLSGPEAYDLVCAGCHDDGLNGAPRIGDREAWSGRSWLWEAVLFEHAESGFFAMPAKGGDESIDDVTVSKAAEYMLTQTFPEALKD